MAANIQVFSEYIHCESGDPVAPICLQAAKQYAKNAEIPEPTSDNALYDLFIYALAGYWYDNRSLMNIGQSTEETQKMTNSFINSLRWAGDSDG